jgi:polyhydroxyalkanoate synthesis repressor PhaR
MLESVSYDTPSSFGSRVIKRYSNRKLYDTKSSRYVTLLQIAQMVRSGEEVQIIDNRTKEDKTEVTLALIISEELKNSPGGISLTTLKALIRHDSNPPPSGEQPTFAGARALLGLALPALGADSLRTGSLNPGSLNPGSLSVGAFGAGGVAKVHSVFGAADPLEGADAEPREITMSDALKPRPEGGRAPGTGSSTGSPTGDTDAVWGGSGSVEHRQFEQWRTELEARVKGLPDLQTVVGLQGQVQRLDERVAELEQRLSKQEE